MPTAFEFKKLKMNVDTSFSFKAKETEADSQNTSITPIQKHINGSPGTFTSINLSPTEKYGNESIKEPLDTESGASCLDLKMGKESLNINRHIYNGLEPKEDCKNQMDSYDNCSSSSMTNGDQVEETHPDDNSKQTITSSREGSCDDGTWVKMELPREIAQNLVRFVGKKLEGNKESPSDMEMQLLAAKNMIVDQLEINDGKCDGLARTGETGVDLDLPDESDEGNSVFDEDASSHFLRKRICTILKPSNIFPDYEESLKRFGSGNSTKLLKMIYTCLDLSDMVLEYQKVLFARSGNGTRADMIRGLMDTSLYLREFVRDYAKSLNPRFGTEDSTKLLQEIIVNSEELRDVVLQYNSQESLNASFNIGAKVEVFRDLMQANLDMKEIVRDYQESLNVRISKENSTKLQQKLIDTSLELRNLILEYQEGLDPIFAEYEHIIKLKDISLNLMDAVRDYEKSLNSQFGKGNSTTMLHLMIFLSLKLNGVVLKLKESIDPSVIKSFQARLIRELMDYSVDLKEIILKYEKSLNPIFGKGANDKRLQETPVVTGDRRHQVTGDTSLNLNDTIGDGLEIINPSPLRCRNKDCIEYLKFHSQFLGKVFFFFGSIRHSGIIVSK